MHGDLESKLSRAVGEFGVRGDFGLIGEDLKKHVSTDVYKEVEGVSLGGHRFDVLDRASLETVWDTAQ